MGAVRVLEGYRVFRDNGDVATDATATFYLAGTTTLQEVFSDRNLSASLGTTVSASSTGVLPDIFVSDAISVKVVIAATGYTTDTIDYLTVATAGATTFPSTISPTVSDGAALGTASLMWSDLFLAAGAVINLNAGDVTITHAANVLSFGGAATGYLFDNRVAPASSDGAALGSTTLMWADAFFAKGAVLNFWDGDVTITHGTNSLAFAGASAGYTFDASTLPAANDGAALGASGTAWSDVFLASGAVINFNAGNYTLTHSAGLLTASGPLSLGTSNALTAGSIELGNASDTTLSRAAAGRLAVEGVQVSLVGKKALPIPASAMVANTTNGPAAGTVETSTNKVMYRTLDFDTTTQESAQFLIAMPSSWNEGTITAQFCWTAASGSGGVVWNIAGVAFGDDDALDTAFGTAQQVADTLLTAGDVHWTSETSAVTIAGSPAANDLVVFRVQRVPADGSDTLNADARLIALRLFITTNDSIDA